MSDWSSDVCSSDLYDADTRSTRGTPTQIALGALPLRCAEPSPDGSVLAIASDHQQPDVYVVDSERGDISPVTRDPALEGCPRWSPDGSRIAFHSNAGGLNRLWIANADGTDLRVGSRGVGDLSHPVWSPDGRSLAAWDGSAGAMRIVSLSANGPSSTGDALPSLPHSFTPLAWSPDGSRIAGTSAGALWIYLTAKRTYERLVPGSSATWLSNGRRLIFASEGRLILLDVPSRFTREILSLPDLHLDSPVLSADDRHLYFSRNAPEANLWVVTLR